MTADTMAFTISKAEEDTIADLSTNLINARKSVQDALNDYGAILAATRDFRNKIVQRLTSEFERKSQRFRNGQKGDFVAGFISLWEDIDLDDPEVDLQQPARLDNLPGSADEDFS